MINLEDNKHLLYAVRIIFEKKEIEGHPPINDVRIRPLVNDAKSKGDENKNLYVADASIDLHRAESEGYAENLQSSDPSIYIVLRDGDLLDDNEEVDNENNSVDIHLAEVSLSPYNIQDYEDCGEDKVEKVPLYGPIEELLNKFVGAHFHPEKFKKRKRDKKNIDENIRRGGDQRLKKNYYN